MQERDRLYSQPSMSEDEGLHAAELENEFATLDGYIGGVRRRRAAARGRAFPKNSTTGR